MILAANLRFADRTALTLRLRHNGIDSALGPDSITDPLALVRRRARAGTVESGFSAPLRGLVSLFDHSSHGAARPRRAGELPALAARRLERTIMDIRGIDSARVMLTMGRPITIRDGPVGGRARLSDADDGAGRHGGHSTMAAAIPHLVATSVRGLDVDSITVTGNDGAILYQPCTNRDGELGEAMRVRNDFEHRLETKVAALLGRIMGNGRVRRAGGGRYRSSRVTSTDKFC